MTGEQAKELVLAEYPDAFRFSEESHCNVWDSEVSYQNYVSGVGDFKARLCAGYLGADWEDAASKIPAQTQDEGKGSVGVELPPLPNKPLIADYTVVRGDDDSQQLKPVMLEEDVTPYLNALLDALVVERARAEGAERERDAAREVAANWQYTSEENLKRRAAAEDELSRLRGQNTTQEVSRG